VAERAAVVKVVRAGNILLQAAIAEANEENLQSLATVWRGLAFQVARNFATQMSEQYAKPMVVEFEYLEPPTVDRQSSHSEVTVTSREKWAYGGPTAIDREEVFDFIYTLTKEDESWIISRYTYRNVPASDLTPAATSSPTPNVTATLTPTAADLEGE
jgi:hypothetical protein